MSTLPFLVSIWNVSSSHSSVVVYFPFYRKPLSLFRATVVCGKGGDATDSRQTDWLTVRLRQKGESRKEKYRQQTEWLTDRLRQKGENRNRGRKTDSRQTDWQSQKDRKTDSKSLDRQQTNYNTITQTKSKQEKTERESEGKTGSR